MNFVLPGQTASDGRTPQHSRAKTDRHRRSALGLPDNCPNFLSKVFTITADKFNELNSINIDLVKAEINGAGAHCDTNLALQSDRHGQKPKFI
jgi:hypothetical protein